MIHFRLTETNCLFHEWLFIIFDKLDCKEKEVHSINVLVDEQYECFYHPICVHIVHTHAHIYSELYAAILLFIFSVTAKLICFHPSLDYI